MSTAALTSSTRFEHQDEDDMLEKMLLEAERLAAQMRSASSSSSAFLTENIPETIDLRDNQTETSSIDLVSSQNWDYGRFSLSLSGENGEKGQFSYSTIEEEGDTEQIFYSSPSTPSRPKSTSSNKTPAEEVEAAVQAAEQMAKALAELNKSKADELQQELAGTPDTSSLGLNSPFPQSPESVQAGLGDASESTHRRTNTTGSGPMSTKDPFAIESRFIDPGSIRWEKIEYTREEDDDYTPMADYSRDRGGVPRRKSITPKEPRRQTRQNNNNNYGYLKSPAKIYNNNKKSPIRADLVARRQADEEAITWEKVSHAHHDDEDYVAVQDYSRDTLSVSEDRPRGRRKRLRRVLRMFAVLALLLVIFGAAYYYYFGIGFVDKAAVQNDSAREIQNQAEEDAGDVNGKCEIAEQEEWDLESVLASIQPAKEEMLRQQRDLPEVGESEGENELQELDVSSEEPESQESEAKQREKFEEEEAANLRNAEQALAMTYRRLASGNEHFCAVPFFSGLSPLCRKKSEATISRGAGMELLLYVMME